MMKHIRINRKKVTAVIDPHPRGLAWWWYTRRGNRLLLLFPPLIAAAGLLVLWRGLRWLPSCFFYDVTGLHCPGCGGVRCTLHLLQGDLPGALHYHPLLPFVYTLLAGGYLAFAWQALFRRQWRPLPLPRPRAGIALLVLTALYWVVRNLPFYTAVFY